MELKDYANILSSRLDKLQSLQAASAGLLGTVSLAAFATYAKVFSEKSGFTFPENEHIFDAGVMLFTIIYVWGHLFGMYQLFAIIKCVKVLSYIESQLPTYAGPKYFESGHNVRNFLHVLTHCFPSILLFAFISILHKIKYLNDREFYVYIFAFVTLTIILIWAFRTAFNFPLTTPNETK